MADYNTQAVEIENVENARQLGGYIGSGGKRVADHKLIRTASLNKADKDKLGSFCRKYNISNIVDLRTKDEMIPSPDPEVFGVTNTLINVLGKEIIVSGQEKEMMDRIFESESFAMRYVELFKLGVPIMPEKVYMSLFFSDEGRLGFKRFFDIVLNAPEGDGVMFHCTQGKDRTGVAAAMLLMALGVDEETIFSDYMLTNVAFASKLERIKKEIPEVTDNKSIMEFALFMESVNRDYFIKPQKRILKDYGGFDGYIKNGLGLTDSDITELQRRYLV